MIEIKRRINLLGQAAVRVVRNPHILLFQYNIKFGAHDFVRQYQSGDPVGLERHHFLELLARNTLEEARIVT